MAQFVIQGGKTLQGTIAVRGSKNHATKVFPASLLFETSFVVANTPLIEDIFRGHDLLRDLGFKVTSKDERSFEVTPGALKKNELTRDIAERIRTSILFVGPLLARRKKVFFPHPGGCVIGKRPIDLFLDGWQAMGARIKQTPTGYAMTAQTLRGIDYTFRKPSHTATESLMMTAVLVKGRTVLRNAACEIEIVALADFLNKSGSRISGAGTPTITIEGTGGTLLKGTECTIIPDRLDAGTLAILGALAGNNMRITHCNPDHLSVLIAHLRAVGARIQQGEDWIAVSKAKTLKPLDIKTKEYPGFVTDYQAPFTVLLTQAQGQSLVFETIFEGRLNYIEDLNRMGANIIPCDPHRVIVIGPTPLHGRQVESPDLRAGLAFVIAGLIAKGESRIGNVYQIDRGYEKIDERLRKLGADIRRIEEVTS
ncbi:MAG: UDP-N-acetylglucosamine 1-carboxyvinyltransferase [Patescibacteria group bacterium]